MQARVYNRHMSNIVITGTSRGIGLATAPELARAGHQVVATMRNPAGSPELGEQAAKAKLPVRIETMDVDSDESVKQAFGQILAQGPVDVLVNNAGIEKRADCWDVTEEDYDAVLNVNLKGVFFATQAVVRHLRETKRTGSNEACAPAAKN